MRVARLLVRLGDRQVLSAWVRSRSIRVGLAQRARIVLLAADGVSKHRDGDVSIDQPHPDITRTIQALSCTIQVWPR